jgi:hypothetical protein
MGELSTYDGGLLRGAETPRIDALAKEGLKLLNFAPETQCTPSRSALMTGRYSIRSGNHTVALAGSEGGLVGPTELKLRPDLTRGDCIADFAFGTGKPFLASFWPQKPEIMPVLSQVGKSP